MVSKRLITAYCFSMGAFFLCVFYLNQNWGKVEWTTKKISAIMHGEWVSSLKIQNGSRWQDRIQLPASDITDKSGRREVNFSYLSKNEWKEFVNNIGQAKFFLNEEEIESPIISVRKNAAVITLPEKKLYILAPPHLDQFIKAVQYEKKFRRDVFTCVTSGSFCNDVKVINFGGMTEIKNKIRHQDAFFDAYPLPAGRWISDYPLELKISSKNSRSIRIRFILESPFAAQKIVFLKPRGVQPKMTTSNEVQQQFSLGKPMYSHDILLVLPLKQGENIISMALTQVTKKTRTLPFSMAGVIKEIIISNDSSDIEYANK